MCGETTLGSSLCKIVSFLLAYKYNIINKIVKKNSKDFFLKNTMDLCKYEANLS